MVGGLQSQKKEKEERCWERWREQEKRKKRNMEDETKKKRRKREEKKERLEFWWCKGGVKHHKKGGKEGILGRMATTTQKRKWRVTHGRRRLQEMAGMKMKTWTGSKTCEK